MKRFLSILVLFFVLNLQVCAAELVILHTSDIHGRIFPTEYENTNNLGGISKRITLFKNSRKSDRNVLIFDVGDYYQGSVIDTVYGAKYSPKYMKGYDVVTFGNHEFDNGLNVLKKYLKSVNTEYISTNLKFNDKYFTEKVKPYKVFNIDNEKILVLGVVTPKCASLANMNKVEILDTEKLLTKYIKEIPHDRVILLSHSGILYDRQIAQNVKGIDIILGGHDHIFAKEKVGNTWIFHTGEFGVKVDKIVYNTTTGAIKQDYIIIDKNISDDVEIEKNLKKLKRKTEKFLNKKLFYTTEELDGSHTIYTTQTNLGQLVLKSFVDYFGNDFDIAFTNSGSIRVNKKLIGYITMQDVYEMLPFDNRLVKLSTDGKTLKQTLERGKTSGKSYLQVYSKIDKIDENKIYKVITLDYLYHGGDGYTELKNSTLEKTTNKCYRDIFIKYLSK